ncbi:MAG: outer membrane lipoprotein-sorting protein [Trueperaceae bacterium]
MTLSLARTAYTTRLATLLVLALLIATANAQQYRDADELMAAVNARPEPATTEATLSMTITTAGGQTLTRELQMWAEGTDARVMKFTAPADIAGSGFLNLTHADGAEEKLVYLPALGRVRRIAGGQQGDAFFGSDFSYEDITGIEPDDYTHELIEVREGPTYVVAAVPLPGTGSVYERLVISVPEATLVPVQVEYYQGGELVKTLTVSGLTEVDGYTLALERRMETLRGGQVTSYTVIAQRAVKLDQELPTDLFTERFLRR